MILCIDDEDLGLKVRKLVLEGAGYQVLTAIDGSAGLALFANEPVEAVVLDYFMPVMNGGEVAQEMRRLRPSVPILMLSAYVNLPDEIERLVDCTILKGAGPDVLLAKLQESLGPPMQAGDREVRS
ncbi:MAG TPA: response regulator [Silvibacterium sp.]|nr:response regulator [Silvibacterium sp.]